MSDWLLVYEDPHWAALTPLADLLPVPALRFGAGTLAGRWQHAVARPLLGLEARAPVLAAWREGPEGALAPADAASPEADDEVLVANAAAVPGPWLDRALAGSGPGLFTAGGRIAAARVRHRDLAPGLGRGGAFERYLLGLGLEGIAVEARHLARPWDFVRLNAEALAADLAELHGSIEGDVDPRAVLLEPARIRVECGARVDALAVLDARDGPILVDRDAVVLPHTLVRGPCVVGPGTELLGGSISRSTLGPQCRVAGEVEECVWQGYGNKRHHGFVGHSVVGEWVNLGALTTTSDLKNNYGPVRVWDGGGMRDTGLAKVGAFLGAHVKTGIGTLLPTGCSVGPGSNLFGGGRFAPRHLPAFSWWDGSRTDEHRLEAFLVTAQHAQSRRGRSLGAAEETLLRVLHAGSSGARAAHVAATTGRGDAAGI